MVGSEEGGGKRATRAAPRQPPILLGTSVLNVDDFALDFVQYLV